MSRGEDRYSRIRWFLAASLFHCISFHCPAFLFSSAFFFFSSPFRKYVRIAHNVIKHNMCLLWQRLTAVLLLGVVQQTAAVSWQASESISLHLNFKYKLFVVVNYIPCLSCVMSVLVVALLQVLNCAQNSSWFSVSVAWWERERRKPVKKLGRSLESQMEI